MGSNGLMARLALVIVVALSVAGPARSDDGEEQGALRMVVHKTPTCGCCTKWVDHVRDHGFAVEVIEVSSTRAAQDAAGVPRTAGSCHTATIGGYFVEGHVPADLIQKLLQERPENVRGILVPGMPAGSPGMESPNPQVYDILAYGTDDQFYRYATRQGKPAE